MTEAANNAITKINEAMAEGKSFAEAAEAAGLDAVHSFENITAAHEADPTHEPQSLFEAARVVTPGSVAELLIEADRAFILFVESRELVRDENVARMIDMQLEQAARGNQSTAQVAWLRARTAAADVQQLWKRR